MKHEDKTQEFYGVIWRIQPATFAPLYKANDRIYHVFKLEGSEEVFCLKRSNVAHGEDKDDVYKREITDIILSQKGDEVSFKALKVNQVWEVCPSNFYNKTVNSKSSNKQDKIKLNANLIY